MDNIQTRICKDCHEEKTLDNFNKRKSCKVCCNLQQIKYRLENLEKVRKIKKEWRLKNKDIENERSRVFKEKAKDNPELTNKMKQTRNLYLKNKRKTDPNFVMKEAMRRMLTRTLKFKTDRTSKLLGYSAIELKQHIESLFIDGMSWDNRSEWHIDHIRPISSFPIDTPPNIINALSNLQPLWIEENLLKSNKY